MIVYKLERCEEYWMQEIRGLFATREAALRKISLMPDVDKIMLQDTDEEGNTIVITVDSSHHAKPNTDKIVARDGVEVTLQNYNEYMDGYHFYDLEHAGYGVWGIFATIVEE